MRKLIASILSLCLLAALTSCGGRKTENDSPADALQESAAEPQQAAAALGYAAYEPETAVATVNGSAVTWEEYYYWLNTYVQYIQALAAQNGVTLSGWDAADLSGENTNAQAVILSAQYAVVQYHVMETKADELGVTLDDADTAAIQTVYDQSADSVMGDGDGTCTQQEAADFDVYLSQQNVSREFFDYLNQVSLLNEKTFSALYGEAGELLSDEDILAFVQDNGIMAARHILLLASDPETGEALTDEQLAEKRSVIDGLYDRLSATEGDLDELNSLFEELMAQYTEDPDYDLSPEGYTFVPGAIDSAVEDAVSSLAEYELSPVIETDSGYLILQRIPVGVDDTVIDTTGQTVNLRYGVANQAFSENMTAWIDEADTVWNDGFGSPDMAAIFGELS